MNKRGLQQPLYSLMKINYRVLGDQDKCWLFTLYKTSMYDHIEKIWGWNETWQKNEFENGIKKYDTQILTFNNIDVGYIQTGIIENSLYLWMMILKKDEGSNGV